MATVKGVLVFNETLTAIETWTTQSVNFTADNYKETSMSLDNGALKFAGDYNIRAYNYSSNSWYPSDGRLRTVDFGETAQTVSDEFYTWLTANATSQSTEEPEDILYFVRRSSLTAIADSIREKTGKADSLSLTQMATEIDSIEADMDTTDATATPDGIISGQTAYVNGQKITGTMPDNGAITSTMDGIDVKTITIPAGYTSGGSVSLDDTIDNEVDLQADLIEQITQALQGKAGSGEGLPSAENGAFGLAQASEEYGITINNTNKINKYNYSGDVVVYQEYTAKEAFSLLGVRVYSVTANNNPRDLEISINDELKTTVTLAYHTAVEGWNVLYFDSQINVAAGDVIKIYERYEEMPRNISLSYATINPKIEVKNGFAGGFSSSAAVYGIFDVIIAPVQAELPDTYKVERTTLDDMAVELQRITNVNTKINIEQMQSSLESIVLQEKTITPTTEEQTVVPDTGYYGLSAVKVGAAPICKELTNAEEYTFGVADDPTEYAITNVPALTKGNNNSYYAGMKFKVLSPLSIKGFRMMNYGSGNFSSFTPQLYCLSDSKLIASVSMNCAYGTTADVLLDAPVNLTVGETYAVFIYNSPLAYVNINNVTINSKIGSVVGIASTSSSLSDILASEKTSSLYGVIFPILGNPTDVDIPVEYKIQLETINDIAEETQRITGVTGKMSTAQIITALQELNIELQSKTITPIDAVQEVVPDSDYYGLSKVTVEAAATSEGLPSVEGGLF